MSRTKEELQGVTSLGNQHTAYTFDYDPSLLETFINKHPGRDYFVKFNGTARLRYFVYFVCTGPADGRKQIAEALSV